MTRSVKVLGALGMLALLGFLALALVGCASRYGTTFTEPTALSASDAFDCVTNELGEMGYTVKDADRSAAFIRAEIPEPTAMAMDGEPLFGEMEVSITEGESGRNLRVTATLAEDGQVDRLMEACG